ncbi:hypothetical protein TNCV_1525361 [Trichonephila clavipes]|nr:hypothetical protein TNCV_1525361 [Trichonephila clavipes]
MQQCKLDWDDVLPNSIANDSTCQENTLHLEVPNSEDIVLLYTDSTIALAWLNTPANRLKPRGPSCRQGEELTEGFRAMEPCAICSSTQQIFVSRGLRPCDQI